MSDPPYDHKQLADARIEEWRDDDLALLEYMPKWRGGGGDASRLLIDFKEGSTSALAEAVERSRLAFGRWAHQLREQGLRYVVSLPRSQAMQQNAGAEAIAAALAADHAWLSHAPKALTRTKTVPRSRYQRQPIEVHLESIKYVGPALRLDPRGVILRDTCLVCRLKFATAFALDTHVAGASHVAEARLWARGVAVLMIDDLITDGHTSGASRQILQEAGAGRVFGLFLARTYGR